MKHPIALLLAAILVSLIGAGVLAASVEGRNITLDDDDVKDCAQGGGCALITKALLEQLRKADCRSTT